MTGSVLICVPCAPVFPLAHSAGIKLIPRGEVKEPIQASRGFRPQSSWGRNCRFRQRFRLVNPFIHISYISDCVTNSLCHHKITEPERMGRSSEQVYNVMVRVSHPKDPSSTPYYLRYFGKIVYHLWITGSLFIKWTFSTLFSWGWSEIIMQIVHGSYCFIQLSICCLEFSRNAVMVSTFLFFSILSAKWPWLLPYIQLKSVQLEVFSL